MERQIAEVNRDIKQGLKNWADVCLVADSDGWACHLKYDNFAIMDAAFIFQHVMSNVGIKAGIIDEQKALEFGERLRQLITDMTGKDPHEISDDIRIGYSTQIKA